MTDPLGGDGSPFRSLRRLAQAGTAGAEEQCDLCGEPLAVNHRHLLDLSTREVLCSCPACVILFDRSTAGGGMRRLIPARHRYLTDFSMTNAEWEGLRIPVNMAFFSHNSAAGRVLALYPSPMGPTESLLALDTWEDLERRNPILREMEPDVEALLVNRTGNARDYFLVPIDECYKLVGLIRIYWRGLSGGREVWGAIDEFFASLKERSQARGGRHA